MRVATFNVQHGRTPTGIVDLEALGLSCAALEADILGLQEIDVGMPRSGRQDLAAVAAATTGLTHVFGRAAEIRGGDYGNALLVRGDIDDVEVVPLPSPKGLEPRSALLATVSLGVPALSLSVAVTHLSYDHAEARAQLPVVAAALAGRARPRVLCGDLNLGPAEVMGVLRVHGLILVLDGGATFPARRPKTRIDHVALDGAHPVGVSIPRAPVSDHRPLIVDIETNDGAKPSSR